MHLTANDSNKRDSLHIISNKVTELILW